MIQIMYSLDKKKLRTQGNGYLIKDTKLQTI